MAEEKKPGSDRTKTLDEALQKNHRQQPETARNDWGKRSNDVTDTVSPPENPRKNGGNSNGK